MPHEIAAMVIGIISPIFIFIILSFISKAAGNERKAAEEMLRHGDLIKDISGKIGEITNETRENGKFLIKELEARKAISRDVVNAIENQNAGMEDIANKLSMAIKGEREELEAYKAISGEVVNAIENQNTGMEDIANKLSMAIKGEREELEAYKAISGEVVNAIENQNTGMEDIANKLSVVIKSDREKLDRIDPKDVNQLSALIGLINMVLADISVSATQLLVQLMEEGRRDKREIKEFVSGLVEAYSTGDKNVFFRALKQQLADNPTRVKALQSLSGSSPEVRRDIARILKEMREIITLVNRCDKDNLIRIVFEGGDVWALHEVLKPHFKMDGTAAKT
ncbi:MAG TPA: hypothetical protein HPP84_10110 [Rhodospirillaceae bacterium]|nr:hypothetical protein [Rhodospirillaceae bacterium]